VRDEGSVEGTSQAGPQETGAARRRAGVGWPAAIADGIPLGPPAAPFRSVGFTISATGYAIARRFAATLAPLGLEPRDFALLRTLAASPGLAQQAIAERMGVAPSRMVAFIDSLQRKGLVERRPNPDDRRAHALYLTAAGKRVLKRAFARAVAHERELVRDLSVAEREQLLALLARVGERVGVPAGVHVGMGHPAMADE